MTANELLNKMEQVYQDACSDSKKATELIEKAMFLEDFDLIATIAILEQRPEAHLVSTMRNFRKMGYHVNSHAKSILIPMPVTKQKFLKDGKYTTIAQATKEEKLGIAKGEIPSIKERNYYWTIGYDISDTDCPKEKYDLHKKYRYNDVTHQALLENFYSFAEKMGFEVKTENLPGIGGFYNEKTNEIVLNKTVTSVMLTNLCEHFSDALLSNTTTASESSTAFEKELLTRVLKEWFCIPTDFNKLPLDKTDKLNISYSRVRKAANYISRGINDEMDLARQQASSQEKSRNKHEEVVNHVSENFMMNL